MNKLCLLLLSLFFSLGLTGCWDDIVVHHEPNGNFYEIGNGRRLTHVQADGHTISQFQYSRFGDLNGAFSQDYEFRVQYGPYFWDDYDRGSCWTDFLFTRNSYIRSCSFGVDPGQPDGHSITDYKMSYSDSRLLSVRATGDGYVNPKGPDRGGKWTYDAEISIDWHGGDIREIGMLWTERIDGRVVAERETYCRFSYGTRRNVCRQYPMVVVSFMAELDLFAHMGLLGLGPERLPYSYEINTVVDYENGHDYGPHRDSGTVSFFVNADGSLDSEKAWTRWTYDYR